KGDSAMLPSSTSSPSDPDPIQPPVLSSDWLKKANAVPPISFQQIAEELLPLSLSQGVRNGLRIGAVYGGLLAMIATISFHQSAILQSLLFGGFVGALSGLFIGVVFGLLSGGVTAAVSRLGFYPIRSWVGYRMCVGLLHILLVIGSVVVCALNFPFIREIFTIYEPGRYVYHTFSSPMYTIITFGFGYGGVLLACIYSWFHAGILSYHYAQTLGLPQKNTLFGPNIDLYDHLFQKRVFGTLANDYSRIANLASLGQSDTLRARVVERMHLLPGMAVCDLMTGGGEMWPHLLPLIGPDGSIVAVDFTPEMLARAQKRLYGLPEQPTITLHQADARATGLPAEHFDAVVCAFGISTMTATQFDTLLAEVHRILRPGGIFGFVELSRPGETQRRWMEMYLTRVVPPLSELLNIDARAYQLLNEYVARFDGGQLLLQSFHMRRYTFYRYEFFGGWAVAFVGMKEIG
ncbi:MAG TPA: class I SAM-dependent methyltransferase, partial [Roseiflexaceae bacterium]|nr:class I SAM-dependent methyltransferase [Roseiflexaceae bacterium]